MASKAFEQAVEKKLGEPIERVRDVSIDARRQRLEGQRKRASRFRSVFPLVGRGSVLRGRAVSHQDVEAQLERAIRGAEKA